MQNDEHCLKNFGRLTAAKGVLIMVSDAQKRATEKYKKENMEQLKMWVKKGTIQKIKDYAATKETTMTEYIKGLINADMGEEIFPTKQKTED